MKKLCIVLPLLLVFATIVAIDDVDGRGRVIGPPGRRPPGPGATGSGEGQGADKPEEPPRETPSTPGKIEGEEGAERGADTRERPKKPEDALKDEIALHVERVIGECIARSASRLVRRAFRGAQGDSNRKAGDCPVPEHPAKEPAPAVEKDESGSEEEQK